MVDVSINHFVAVTPADGVDLPDYQQNSNLTDRLWIGVGGTVAVVEGGSNGATVNFTVVAGQELRIAVRRVNLTNTTATGIVAGYVI